jgi:hypothetical protein
MANPAGESNAEVLRLDFDRRLMLQFRGSVVLAVRERHLARHGFEREYRVHLIAPFPSLIHCSHVPRLL